MAAKQTIFDKAASMLTGKSKSDSATIQETIREVGSRISEIDNRLDAINEHNGSVYRKTAETGSPDDLVALDHEREQIAAERKALGSRKKQLHRQLEDARASEARANLKQFHQQAVSAADRVVAAREELAAAEAAMQSTANEIDGKRQLIGDDALLSAKDARRVAAAMVDPAEHNRTAGVEDIGGARSARGVTTLEAQARKYTRPSDRKAAASAGSVQREAGVVAD